MSDIFISYSSPDRARVKPLVEALKQQGWSVWWDRTILAGKTFDRVIEAALKDSRCVIVLWSRDSIESDWVWTEADEGKRRGILVPAMLDDVHIPFAFRRIHTANLIGWSGGLPSDQFDELARAVSDVLSNIGTSHSDTRPQQSEQPSQQIQLEQERPEQESPELVKQADAPAEQLRLEREQKERTAKLGQQLYQKLMSEDLRGEERIRRLRTVLELSPDHMQAMRDLAAALHGVKRDYEAAEYLKCAIHMGLRDEAALREYAEIQTSIKNREIEQEEFLKDEGRKGLERERVEQEAKAQAERERLEREKNENAKARLKQVRQDAEQRLEQQKQQAEQKRLEREKKTRHLAEQEQLEREKAAKAERERLEDESRARAQQERLNQERKHSAERAQQAHEEKRRAEQAELEQLESEKQAQERAEIESKAQAEQEPGARDVKARAEQERLERKMQAQAHGELEQVEREKQVAAQAEQELLEREKQAQARAELKQVEEIRLQEEANRQLEEWEQRAALANTELDRLQQNASRRAREIKEAELKRLKEESVQLRTASSISFSEAVFFVVIVVFLLLTGILLTWLGINAIFVDHDYSAIIALLFGLLLLSMCGYPLRRLFTRSKS